VHVERLAQADRRPGGATRGQAGDDDGDDGQRAQRDDDT
jgi:hypothetical protein